MNTSHVKQVATFEKLLGFCNAQGAMFNPSRGTIQSTALSSLLTSAQLSLEAVKTARTEYMNAVNTRNEAFNGLPKFMTRVVNTLAANGASAGTVKESYMFIKKIYRPKVKPVKTEEGSAEVTRRLSFQDFDSKADLFEGMVKLILMEPSYNPNEAELNKASLESMVKKFHGLNTTVMESSVKLSNARAKRNEILYRTGIHGTAQDVKKYMKGVFGYQSVAYNQIKSLRFLTKKVA